MTTVDRTDPQPAGVADGAADQAVLEELADALDRFRRGDFNVRLTRRTGLAGDVADRFNEVVAVHHRSTREVRRICRVVGREGQLAERLDEEAFEGGWQESAGSINKLIDDLVRPSREFARVIESVAAGDLSQRSELTIDERPLRGEFQRIGKTVNAMVEQLSSFTDEVTRVAREVGTDGILGGQADVRGATGTWRDLTDSVNLMASNLTNQVRSISAAATAIAQGDLSRKITVGAKGEVAELADTINSLTDTLRVFAEEVTRVAREVGTEGKLGGQADVRGASGTWRDLTDNVNSMAANLTSQVRNIAQVSTAVAKGDLSQKITVNAQGEILELKSTVNTMVDQLSSFADEVTRVAREVGTEGKLGGQARVSGVSGTWRDLTDNVNSMAGNLTAQVRNIAHVSTAVARGDLSQQITVDAQGEILELKNTMNTMVDQLSSFADEVTRVAREVGTEGKLGGQARVTGVSGTWQDLTNNVNSMASNLTTQVRNIASVTTAVARGDLSQKITVDAQGEILELKNTVNTMVDQLSSFADEVTRVAREVGTEGKLGGQAHVKGVSGTWQDLTENVNQLASTLTTQLRAIAEVSTAVTRGDLTRTVAVAAMGEVAELKDNINQMIVTLRDTTKKNAEQDWMNSNLARVSALLQGQRDIGEVCRMIMNEVTPLVNAQVGAFFMHDTEEAGAPRLRLISSYGYVSPGTEVVFAPGEGLVGQAVLSRRTIRITGTPEGYLTVRSGLGTAPPSDVVVLPVIFEGEPLGVIEFASFGTFSGLHLTFLDRLVTTIAIALNTILANRRTEELLSQSQRLAREMQDQSAELQRTNAELEEKATALAEQKQNIEVKNREIEMARLGLEEKAQQLARASQYKSEFLANMSHELRTPLNSLLLLARMLADNPERNLTDKQIDFARTIHSSGSELLVLINDILDLSKVEAGRMDVQPAEVPVEEITGYVQQAFQPQVNEKKLRLSVSVADGVPERLITDAQRLQQILRNLFSNAVKFTEPGGQVSLRVEPTPADTRFGVASLDDAEQTVSFAVSDTGIGIPEDKLQLIFDAFQQADGTTSRKYGGTGLGLSISREAAKLLGGMITVRSEPGHGSTFTLTIPAVLPAETAAALASRPAEPWKPVSVQEAATSLVPIVAPPAERTDDEAASEPEPKPERTAAPDLAGVRVLIVDDDIRNVYALSSALEMHGMTVLYADNGSDGVRKLTEDAQVDIVLMDAMMPEMDGYETTQLIRQKPEFADLPIVFLTAKAMPGDRDKSLEAGASDYIAKPVDLDELLDLMASWLPDRGAE